MGSSSGGPPAVGRAAHPSRVQTALTCPSRTLGQSHGCFWVSDLVYSNPQEVYKCFNLFEMPFLEELMSRYSLDSINLWFGLEINKSTPCSKLSGSNNIVRLKASATRRTACRRLHLGPSVAEYLPAP